MIARTYRCCVPLSNMATVSRISRMVDRQCGPYRLCNAKWTRHVHGWLVEFVVDKCQPTYMLAHTKDRWVHRRVSFHKRIHALDLLWFIWLVIFKCEDNHGNEPNQ